MRRFTVQAVYYYYHRVNIIIINSRGARCRNWSLSTHCSAARQYTTYIDVDQRLSITWNTPLTCSRSIRSANNIYTRIYGINNCMAMWRTEHNANDNVDDDYVFYILRSTKTTASGNRKIDVASDQSAEPICELKRTNNNKNRLDTELHQCHRTIHPICNRSPNVVINRKTLNVRKRTTAIIPTWGKRNSFRIAVASRMSYLSSIK